MTLVSRSAFGFALLALAGCGGGPESPLDEDQATERVERHLTDTAGALPDTVELEALGPSISAPCNEYEFVTVSKRYWLRGLPTEDNEDNVEALHEYWKDNGFTVTEDQRPDELYIYVRHNKDDFAVSVQESKQGDLSLGASSPCIDEFGADS